MPATAAIDNETLDHLLSVVERRSQGKEDSRKVKKAGGEPDNAIFAGGGRVVGHGGHEYIRAMADSKSLETLMERAASWPDEAQAELVRFMIDTEAKHFGVYRLSDEEREAVRQGLEDARQGRFATDEEVAALFRRYRGR